MAIDAKPTQAFVPIKEIRDGVIMLKDGSMRAILLASSLNFALKSADEQQSIIFQFQNFLNSLNFSVQIYTQSRRLDIRPYIALLEERLKDQVGDLMKMQTREYIEFIRSFTESSSIMTKSFFIVIPYSPPIASGVSAIKKGFFGNKTNVADEKSTFEENRSQLQQRTQVVEQGLVRCGIRIAELGTEELIELFYKTFNPGDAEKPINLGNK
ncbi:MAG TPA: TraC family protein [Candidatus Paceibacterota bacterium]